MFEGHTVGGDENAGAVFAIFAMDENFLPRFADQREKFGELCGSRNGETAYRNGNEMHAERFRTKAFLLA